MYNLLCGRPKLSTSTLLRNCKCPLSLQLRMAVVEAIGYIVHLVSPAQLDSQLPKLLPLIAQLYKKHQEHYYISQVTMATVELCISPPW